MGSSRSQGRSVRQALDLWIGANLEHHHVKVYRGRATFVDAHTVMVEGESEPTRLEAGVLLIATGSTPRRQSPRVEGAPRPTFPTSTPPAT